VASRRSAGPLHVTRIGGYPRVYLGQAAHQTPGAARRGDGRHHQDRRDRDCGVPPLTVFTVSKSAHPAPLPKPGATIASREFGFIGASKIRDGEMVRWQNIGFLTHMIVGAQASSLANAQKLAALVKAGNDNAAQALAINFYSWDNVLSHGQYFQTVISQPAGFWVIACFMDTQDGREHTTLGMEKVIQIVK
jgi:hypothetical protein